MFITFEGPDGSGKTTQAALLAETLSQQGYRVIRTREPGGTSISEQIREVLHRIDNTEMAPVAEVLLYAASRAQHVVELIRPALDRDEIVICDRFYDSTFAYQGYGHQLDLEMLRTVTHVATGGLAPDLTLFIDLDAETALERRKRDAGVEWNRLDAQAVEFHQRVYAGYQILIAAEPDRFVVINGAQPKEDIQQSVLRIVLDKLGDPA